MEQEDIRKWIEENSRTSETPLSPEEELEHLSMCMHHIYLWYTVDYPLGRFLTAVVKNDFMEACLQADGVNRKSLHLYTLFLANKLPLDYQVKARKGK